VFGRFLLFVYIPGFASHTNVELVSNLRQAFQEPETNTTRTGLEPDSSMTRTPLEHDSNIRAVFPKDWIDFLNATRIKETFLEQDSLSERLG